MSEIGRLRPIGALWKPKPGAKSLGAGRVTVNGMRQRFVLLPNDRKTDGSNEPDYVLLSSADPEVDTYTPKRRAIQPERNDAALDGDIPF